MSSSESHHEHPKGRRERSRSRRRRRSTRQDPQWTEHSVPSSAEDTHPANVPFESIARSATSWLFDSRYSHVELPEVVVPERTLTGRQRRERELQDGHRKSRKSDKIFVPPSESPVSKDETTRPRFPFSATTLYTISHLVFYSILGTLARLGIEAITFYPSAPVTSPILWANLGGSILMGFLSEDQRIFREEWGTSSLPEEWSFHPATIESDDPEIVQQAFLNHGKVKKTIPLFIGLATGFCGSFTSFSSFIRDAFLALSNGLPSSSPSSGSMPSRNGGYSFEAVLAILIIHITVSLSALKCGAHLALALDPVMPTLTFKSIRTILDPLTVLLGLGSWAAAIFLTAFPPQQHWRGRVTFALVLAPLGCLLRFYVSRYLNSRIPSFPLGTFTINVFGTMVLGMCFDLQHSTSIAGDILSCQVLQGVMEGFCGCATTVSTWVAELNGLKREHAYFYGFTSVVVALLFLIVTMGSLQWSRGFDKPVCI
jgi:fluoride exporter